MTSSNDLFELIKSLSKSEKRYFRMFASLNARGGSSKYLQLFDLIDARSDYDEEKVRSAFAEKFAVRHFSEAKYYLYNAILRSLHMYGIDQWDDMRIMTTMHHAMLLFDKKLFRQSEKLLARAREQAVENQRWHLAVEAQQLQYRIREQTGTSPQEVDALVEQMLGYNEIWRGNLKHWGIYVRLLTRINTTGRPRNSEQLAEFGRLLEEEHDTRAPHAESQLGAIYRLYSHAIYQQAGGDYRGAAESFRMMLPMLQSGAWAEHLSVTPILYNICMLSIKGRDAATFQEHYPLLMERTDKSPRSAYYKLHITALTLQPEFHLMMGDYHAALATSAELELALDLGDDLLDVASRAYIMMLLLSIHFGLGNHDRCIEYLNIIFAMKPDGLPAHRYGVARIYQLMIHFERGDDDLLEHLLRSAHRYFIASGRGFRAEKAIITFIKRALRSGSRREWAVMFRDLLNDITPLLDDPFESGFLNWIDLISWLESRISNRPYAEIRRERKCA
jgi:hypothetical protein